MALLSMTEKWQTCLGVWVLGLIPWAVTSTLPLTSCGTLGKLFNLSEPQGFHLKSGSGCTCPRACCED